MEIIGTIWDALLVGMAWAWDNIIGPLWDAVGPAIVAGMEIIGTVWGALVDSMKWVWDNILEPIFSAFEYVLDLIWGILEPIVDAIMDLVDAGGELIGAGLDMLGFAEGGVVTGPESGYPVMLHGTEAVVPLSGGRSIPVELEGGGGGGGGNTYNITINPSGMTDRTDKREFARKMSNAIQQEIARASGGSTMRSGR
jgi:hypothetical protein